MNDVSRADAEVIIRSKMARLVIPETQEDLDVRTAFALANAGVITNPLPDQLPSSVLNAIRDIGHTGRRSQIEEPLLALELGEDRPYLIELELCLLNPNSEVRLAVLGEIDRKIAANSSLMSDATKQILEAERSAIESGEQSTYMPACIRVHDALVDDIHFNLALLRQACRVGISEHIAIYLGRLLHPSVHGLSSLGSLQLLQQLVRKGPLVEIASEISESSNDVDVVLNHYFEVLGYVPLTGELGLGGVLAEWAARTGQVVKWGDLIRWANKAPSPLRLAQACVAALHFTDSMDEADLAALNGALSTVLMTTEEGPQDAWSIRTELARHYCMHLSCTVPSADTHRISASAWWLADQVANAIAVGPAETCKQCRRQIDQAQHVAQRIWMIAHPWSESSPLYAATIHNRNLWTESVAAELAIVFKRDGKTILSPETAVQFLEVLLQGTLIAHDMQADGTREYSFQHDVYSLVVEMRDASSNPKSVEFLEEVVTLMEEVNSIDALSKALFEFANLPTPKQRIVAFALQLRSYATNEAIPGVWECLKNDSWRKSFAGTADDEMINRICDACIRWQGHEVRRHSLALPHLLLLAASECVDRPHECDTLVGYCVAACTASGCTSALERGASADFADGALVPFFAAWHRRVEEIIRHARPLAASRMRAVKLALANATLQTKSPLPSSTSNVSTD